MRRPFGENVPTYRHTFSSRQVQHGSSLKIADVSRLEHLENAEAVLDVHFDYGFELEREFRSEHQPALHVVSGDALIENAKACVPADDFRFAVPNRDGFQPLPVHGPEVELLRLGAPPSEILLCLGVVTRRNLIRSSHYVSRLTPYLTRACHPRPLVRHP